MISLASVIMNDLLGRHEDNLLLVTVYSFFNAYVTVGLLTMWMSGDKFEKVLNSILHLEASMKAGGVGTGSLKWVCYSIGQSDLQEISNSFTFKFLCSYEDFLLRLLHMP